MHIYHIYKTLQHRHSHVARKSVGGATEQREETRDKLESGGRGGVPEMALVEVEFFATSPPKFAILSALLDLSII